MSQKKRPEKPVPVPPPPLRLERPCFTCDGTGFMCNECGESEAACDCPQSYGLVECADCGGTGDADAEGHEP